MLAVATLMKLALIFTSSAAMEPLKPDLQETTQAQEGTKQFRVKTFDREHGAKQFNTRNGAESLLEVNIAALLKKGKLDSKSPEWKNIHKSIQLLTRNKKQNKLLHVRLFVENQQLNYAKSFRAVMTEIKKTLADLDIYVVCIDFRVQNGNGNWDQYIKSKK